MLISSLKTSVVINLQGNKMKIYLCGGAVRDKLLGLDPKDLDYVVVGSSEQEMLDLNYQRVGQSFPVFLHPTTNDEYALARREVSTGPSYQDFKCETKDVTLTEDLSRRDITINSIALDSDGTYIDPFNGQSDIKSKTLRHTSSAFSEDPIRVLRIARLRARFGPYWKIHASTKLLIDKMRPQLRHLQPDRVYAEVAKVMDSPNSHIFFETLDELQVLDVIFPNIFNLKTYREGSVWHKEPNVFEHTMTMLKLADHESPTVKWMILYHDIAKPLCRRLYGNGAGHDSEELASPLIDIQLPAKIKKKVLFHINIHQRIFKIFEMTPKKVAKLIYSFRKDSGLLRDVLLVSSYDKAGATSIIDRPDSDFTQFLLAFNEVNSYSPYQWIQQQATIPNPLHIQQHIHNHAIQIIRRHLCQHTK